MKTLISTDPRTDTSLMRDRLQTVRRHLEREQASAAGLLATPPEDRGEDTTPSQHPADVASDLEIHGSTLARALLDLKELQEVEDALARIENGTYGVCIDCGREIARERLEARPQAARDIECERRWAQQASRRR